MDAPGWHWKKVRWLWAALQGCPVHKDGDVTSIAELQPRLAGDWGRRSFCVLFGASTPKSLAEGGGRWKLRLVAPAQGFSLTVLPAWDPSRCAGLGRRQYSFKSGTVGSKADEGLVLQEPEAGWRPGSFTLRSGSWGHLAPTRGRRAHGRRRVGMMGLGASRLGAPGQAAADHRAGKVQSRNTELGPAGQGRTGWAPAAGARQSLPRSRHGSLCKSGRT